MADVIKIKQQFNGKITMNRLTTPQKQLMNNNRKKREYVRNMRLLVYQFQKGCMNRKIVKN